MAPDESGVFDFFLKDDNDQIKKKSAIDSTLSPVKEVGPATQEITIDEDNKADKLMSRVKVATLGRVATSMMTTRSTSSEALMQNTCVDVNLRTSRDKDGLDDFLFGSVIVS